MVLVSFDTKKAPIQCLLVQLLENCFSVFTRQIHSFLVTHPLLAWGWGQKLAKFAVFLVAKILKMHIFLTFLNGYIHPNNFKNKKQALGALPQTPLSLARPQGQVANPIHLPLR